MTSGRRWIPKLKGGTEPVEHLPSGDRTRGVASSAPQNRPGYNISDNSAARGATSSVDNHSPIDENDIIIAYVLLELHFISLNIMHFIRVMGPTGAGKSSVSFWLCNSMPQRD